MSLSGGLQRFEAAAVLAGGRSRRMGSEKSLVQIGGGTLIEHLLAARASQFDRLAVSVPSRGPSSGLAEALARAETRAGQSIEIVRDSEDDRGPLEGLRSILEQLGASRVYAQAVDLPNVPPTLIAALWKASCAPEVLGCIPRWSRGLEPACAIYSAGLLPAIEGILRDGKGSLHELCEVPGVVALDLDEAESDLSFAFRNLNTPEDVKARRRGGEEARRRGGEEAKDADA